MTLDYSAAFECDINQYLSQFVLNESCDDEYWYWSLIEGHDEDTNLFSLDPTTNMLSM